MRFQSLDNSSGHLIDEAYDLDSGLVRERQESDLLGQEFRAQHPNFDICSMRFSPDHSYIVVLVGVPTCPAEAPADVQFLLHRVLPGLAGSRLISEASYDELLGQAGIRDAGILGCWPGAACVDEAGRVWTVPLGRGLRSEVALISGSDLERTQVVKLGFESEVRSHSLFAVGGGVVVHSHGWNEPLSQRLIRLRAGQFTVEPYGGEVPLDTRWGQLDGQRVQTLSSPSIWGMSSPEGLWAYEDLRKDSRFPWLKALDHYVRPVLSQDGRVIRVHLMRMTTTPSIGYLHLVDIETGARLRIEK